LKNYQELLQIKFLWILLILVLAGILISARVSSSLEQARTAASSLGGQYSVMEIPVSELMPNFGDLPDFSLYSNVDQLKGAFFSYIRPMVEYNNQIILQQRRALISIQEKFSDWESLASVEKEFILALAVEYKLGWEQKGAAETLNGLIRRVDQIPPALALVQAAKESGWGRSRFAIEANNLFGQWCYSMGCGLIPARRQEGATNEVQKFGSVAAAIYSYMNNLNTHSSYEELRSIRAEQQKNDGPVTAEALAEGLVYYSQRREAYVEEIRTMLIQYRNFSEVNGV
jgi:Bax protein